MKIGILTHYYNSSNYGGSLQAYALAKFLNKNGIDAEQICYKWTSASFEEFCGTNKKAKLIEELPVNQIGLKNTVAYKLIRKVYYKTRHIFLYCTKKSYRDECYYNVYKKKYVEGLRQDAFLGFQKAIPHSEAVYDMNNIENSNDNYDGFVVGSDQIWNFTWFNPAFFLEFAKNNKKKISYAASCGKSSFKEAEYEYLNKVIPRFDAISVREKNMVELLRKTDCNTEIKYVLDPVFLLSDKEWNEVAAPLLIKERYLFCYFLGYDDSLNKMASQYAEKHNLKLVSIPYCHFFNSTDRTFGDYRIDAASPEDFVSLIKNADCVFTDSFHATAFSLIYKKEFFTFGREDAKGMNSRIEDITELFGCGERFCNSEKKRDMEYIVSCKAVNYDKDVEKELKKSMDFLLNALKG